MALTSGGDPTPCWGLYPRSNIEAGETLRVGTDCPLLTTSWVDWAACHCMQRGFNHTSWAMTSTSSGQEARSGQDGSNLTGEAQGISA